MTQIPRPASRTVWRLSTIAFLAVLAGGCAVGGTPPDVPPETTTGPSATASVPTAPTSPGTRVPTPAATEAPPATPVPSASAVPELPAQPPVAILAGSDGVPLPGELGGFTWNGAGSAAPWIVPRAALAVTAPGPYAVSFGGDLAPAGWVLRWATVTDGVVGDVAAWADGVGAPVTAAGPDEPGTWSLQADVRFADGHAAAWYWLVDTAP